MPPGCVADAFDVTVTFAVYYGYGWLRRCCYVVILVVVAGLPVTLNWTQFGSRTPTTVGLPLPVAIICQFLRCWVYVGLPTLFLRLRLVPHWLCVDLLPFTLLARLLVPGFTRYVRTITHLRVVCTFTFCQYHYTTHWLRRYVAITPSLRLPRVPGRRYIATLLIPTAFPLDTITLPVTVGCWLFHNAYG